jgi:hypothetical protein
MTRWYKNLKSTTLALTWAGMFWQRRRARSYLLHGRSSLSKLLVA